MKKALIIIILIVTGGIYRQCEAPPVYPDTPVINYESFSLFVTTNSLDQEVLAGRVNFSFTDGDGNVGMDPLPDTLAIGLPDSVRYNMFFQLYDLQEGDFVKIPEEDGGLLKYIIPFLDRQPLQGTISVTIEYPIISYDTIFYTFFMFDRDYNRSNTDTTEIRVLSGIELNQ